MSNVNFFGWIRDGVRQSVLLGVSDAIDQLGTPAAAEELHPDVAAFLQMGASSGAAAVPPKLTGSPRSGQNGRKRLGRSLKDMEAVVQK